MSDYVIRVVTDRTELSKLCDMAVAGFDPQMQCNGGERMPELTDFQSAHRVYAAAGDGQDVAVVTVSESGQMMWLNGHSRHLAPVTVHLARAVVRDYGTAWGDCTVDALRREVVRLSSGCIAEDGLRLRWVG